MRSSVVRSAALVLAVPLLLGAGTVPALAAGSSSVVVEGHVRSPTGKAVPGVAVSVYADPVGGGSYTVTRTRSSRTGRYELRTPANAARYRVKVTDEGTARPGTGDGEWATLVQAFSVGRGTRRLDPVVHHGAKVSGTVVAGTGRPADAGLLVTAVVDGRRTTAYTRRGGVYSFSNLGRGAGTVLVASPSTNGLDRYFVRGTEAGTLDPGKATQLGLEFGRTTTGVDVRFPDVGEITGRITVDGQEPVGSRRTYQNTVLLDQAGKEVAVVATKPTFTFKDVPAGTYFLRFDPNPTDPLTGAQEYYRDSATLQGATPIVLGAGRAVTGIVAALSSAKAPALGPTATPTAAPRPSATP